MGIFRHVAIFYMHDFLDALDTQIKMPNVLELPVHACLNTVKCLALCEQPSDIKQ